MDEIGLVTTRVEDASLDDFALELLLRRLGEHSVDHEAFLAESGIP